MIHTFTTQAEVDARRAELHRFESEGGMVPAEAWEALGEAQIRLNEKIYDSHGYIRGLL